jgi:PAN domain
VPQGSDALQGEMELNTDRPGFDYRNFDLTAADAKLCRAQCEAETQCLSWTYVAPGVQGVNARCWLKKAVPQQMANGCCVAKLRGLRDFEADSATILVRCRRNRGFYRNRRGSGIGRDRCGCKAALAG